ncbi:F-actin-capping protein subunit alpha [Blakeslea trispora]|nr:F-actin-capping protein subunit alpha [Blakeslea trispora]
MTTVSTEDKVKIASDFLLLSPPGEVNDVFNDVRVLVDDDESLQEGILQALEQYNAEQHVTVRPSGLEHDVVLSKHGKIEQDKFLDPRSKKTFKVDHMRLTTSDLEDYTDETALESLRSNVEKECIAYIEDHFPNGVCSVYATESEIAIAIVDNKYNPNNFWNGRWLASWIYNTQSGELEGTTKVNVHYYEDGNVQLKADKKASLHVDMKEDHEQLAKEIAKEISSFDKQYQSSMNDSYSDLAENTFKGLRRALPMTLIRWTGTKY